MRLVILRTCSDHPGICLKLSDFGIKATFESIYLNKVSPIYKPLLCNLIGYPQFSDISRTQKRKCQRHDMAGCMTSTENTWILNLFQKRIMDIWGMAQHSWTSIKRTFYRQLLGFYAFFFVPRCGEGIQSTGRFIQKNQGW